MLPKKTMPRLEFFQDINPFIFLLRRICSYVYLRVSAETVGWRVGLLLSRSQPPPPHSHNLPEPRFLLLKRIG